MKFWGAIRTSSSGRRTRSVTIWHHQGEIERLIEENRPERVIEKYHLKIGAKGEVIFPE